MTKPVRGIQSKKVTKNKKIKMREKEEEETGFEGEREGGFFFPKYFPCRVPVSL